MINITTLCFFLTNPILGQKSTALLHCAPPERSAKKTALRWASQCCFFRTPHLHSCGVCEFLKIIYLIKILVVFGLQIGLQIVLLDCPARKSFKNKGLREFLGVRGGVWVILTGWGWVLGVWGRKNECLGRFCSV